MATFPEEIDKIGGDAHPARRPRRNLSPQDRLDENATPPRALIAASEEVVLRSIGGGLTRGLGTLQVPTLQAEYLTFVILPET